MEVNMLPLFGNVMVGFVALGLFWTTVQMRRNRP